MTAIDNLRKRVEPLHVALEAAELASEVHRTYERTEAELKSHQQLVTEADVTAERRIKNRIFDRYPDHAFVGEESGTDGDSSHVWHVDPIDGTTDFVYELPHSSVSIALVVDGTREVGVVAHPRSGTTYAAVRNEGAYRDGEPIEVSTKSSLDRTLFAMGFSHRDVDDDRTADAFGFVVRETLGVRRYGSSALSLCYTADGTLEGFIHRNLGTWDVAAGSLIVEEAGGIVRNFEGESGDDVVLEGDIVATTESICDQFPFVG